ncbi:hypothetical protein [Actinoplanes sp. NPDC026670]|uniref:hypothetical protein n=1 Tax=Actinoplanes sp. NPDC026670 TaxID=3154700 RepID=UPI0033F45E84
MIDDFSDLRALCAPDGDRQRGWAFVRELTSTLGRPLTDGDGIDTDLLRAAEDRLGYPLPAALREAYLLFGRRRDLTAAQDELVWPQNLTTAPEGVLVFRVEAQHCASWGVPEQAVGQDDPPVLVNNGDGWEPYSDRLSIALVEMVMSEAMFGADEHNVDNRDLDEDAAAAVAAAFEPVPLPTLPFWAGMDGPGVRWLAGPEVLLRDDGGVWLWVHGRTPAAVQPVREQVPGDWLSGPDYDED